MISGAQRRSALIVGAGVAGLTAGLCLARSGWRVTVVERAADSRHDGYVIGLSGPGFQAASRLELTAALRERSRAPATNVFFDHRGQELTCVEHERLLKGVQWVTLRRSDLVAILHDAAREHCDIRFETLVSEFANQRDGVDAVLSDGTSDHFDLMVVADGARSETRVGLFGSGAPRVEHLGLRVAAFEITDSHPVEHDITTHLAPGRLAVFYSLGGGVVSAVCVWRAHGASPVPRAARPSALEDEFLGADPTVRRRIRAAAEGQAHVFWDDVQLIDLPRWDTSRVVLLGDAAHALSLLSGQGAGTAMASAYTLALALRERDIPAALRHHAARMRPLIESLQTSCRRAAARFVPMDGWSYLVRRAFLRWAPSETIHAFLRRSH